MKERLQALQLLLILFYMAILGCNNKETVKAHIFERRQIDGNQLMVKYKYQVQSKEYIDSSTIKNTVIGSDSIMVEIDKNSPEKSTFQVDK